MRTARHHQAGDFLSTKASEALDPHTRLQAFKISVFRGAENLHPFLSEISIETGQREAGAIDGGLANLSMKPDARPVQFYLQLLGMRIVKTLNRNHGNAFSLTAGRCDRLRCRLLRHKRLTFNADGADFPTRTLR
jgi:hypothetical protein